MPLPARTAAANLQTAIGPSLTVGFFRSPGQILGRLDQSLAEAFLNWDSSLRAEPSIGSREFSPASRNAATIASIISARAGTLPALKTSSAPTIKLRSKKRDRLQPARASNLFGSTTALSCGCPTVSRNSLREAIPVRKSSPYFVSARVQTKFDRRCQRKAFGLSIRKLKWWDPF